MKKLRSILLSLLVLVLLVPAAVPALAAAGGAEVPAIGGDKYYLDLAEVFSAEFEADVVSRNTANKGKNLGEIYIVTIKSLGGADLKTFSNALFDKWEIGTKESKNGVLLLMAIEEKAYYAIAGEGVSAKFGGTLDQILKTNVEPDFAAGSYEAAAKKFLDTAEQKVKGTAVAPTGAVSSSAPGVSSEAPASGGGIGDAIWGFFRALLIIVGIVLALGILFVVVANLRSKRRKSTHRGHSTSRGRTGSHPDTRPHSRRSDVYSDEDETVSSDDADDTFGD